MKNAAKLRTPKNLARRSPETGLGRRRRLGRRETLAADAGSRDFEVVTGFGPVLSGRAAYREGGRRRKQTRVLTEGLFGVYLERGGRSVRRDRVFVHLNTTGRG